MKFPICGSSGANALTNANATYYMAPMGRNAFINNTFAPDQIAPATFDISNFNVQCASAPGAGTSWTFTLYVNNVATALTFSIADTATTGGDNTHKVTIAAGSTYHFRVTHSGSTASSIMRWSFVGDSGTGNGQHLGSTWQNGFNSTNGAYVHPISGTGGFAAATESFARFYFPVPGTVKNLRAYYPTAPGGSVSWVQTVRKNGTNSALTCSVTGAATSAADTSHSFTVAAGDYITVSCLPSGGTPTNPGSNMPAVSLEFLPDDGVSSVLGGNTSQSSNTTLNYTSVADCGFFAVTSQLDIPMMLPPCIIKNLNAYLDTAPGVGKSYAFNLLPNNASTPLLATVSGASTTASDTTNNVRLGRNDLVTFSINPTGTPAGNSSTDRQHLAYTVDMRTSRGSFLPLLFNR